MIWKGRYLKHSKYSGKKKKKKRSATAFLCKSVWFLILHDVSHKESSFKISLYLSIRQFTCNGYQIYKYLHFNSSDFIHRNNCTIDSWKGNICSSIIEIFIIIVLV